MDWILWIGRTAGRWAEWLLRKASPSILNYNSFVFFYLKFDHNFFCVLLYYKIDLNLTIFL
jgi:hypothetical protein